ncbi:MAG: DinB family protein [Chloroflexi bacterium]|nr:DinB family protein [Chloroflexota bacterium]
MPSEFESDLATLTADIHASRKELDSAVASITDLDLARRGGWSLRRILEHVIESEWLYTSLVSHLGSPGKGPSGQPIPDRPNTSCDGDTIAQISEKLAACRKAFINTLAGATEDNFYEIQRLGHEEYSILSVLENVANHDREHAEQIGEIVASTS